MTKRQQKIDSLRKEFINHQLAPHGKCYEDVLDDEHWFTKYTTTAEEEVKFRQYIVDRLRESLKMSKKMAEREAGWFILQWGLKVPSRENSTIEYLREKA